MKSETDSQKSVVWPARARMDAVISALVAMMNEEPRSPSVLEAISSALCKVAGQSMRAGLCSGVAPAAVDPARPSPAGFGYLGYSCSTGL